MITPRAYWLLPLLLAGVQAYLALQSAHGIRGEELAESVRNVYWLDRCLIYDGTSTNVGWYGLLLLVYKSFGFSVWTAKFVRLGLHVLGLFSAAALLRRYLTGWTAAVPLIVIGLSPALLYLNTLQTSYGVDIAYAAMCLWLLLPRLWPQSALRGFLRMSACGATAMLAALSYPTFLLYLPALALAGSWSLRRAGSIRAMAWPALGGFIGFCLPLAVAFLYVDSPQGLFFDPATHSGLFRGGGAFPHGSSLIFRTLQVYYLGMPMLRDLFVRGESYYFDVSRPDFAGWLARIGLAGVMLAVASLSLRKGIHRRVVLAAALLFATSLIVPTLSDAGAPGIRRGTGILTAYYVFFAAAWRWYADNTSLAAWVRGTGVALCLLLPLDSVTKFPPLVADARSNRIDQNRDWFAIEDTPQRSLETQMARVTAGHTLNCPVDHPGQTASCRYQEIYAAIAGGRAWNGLPPIDIHAVDGTTGRDLILTPELWTTYYFPH